MLAREDLQHRLDLALASDDALGLVRTLDQIDAELIEQTSVWHGLLLSGVLPKI